MQTIAVRLRVLCFQVNLLQTRFMRVKKNLINSFKSERVNTVCSILAIGD